MIGDKNRSTKHIGSKKTHSKSTDFLKGIGSSLYEGFKSIAKPLNENILKPISVPAGAIGSALSLIPHPYAQGAGKILQGVPVVSGAISSIT